MPIMPTKTISTEDVLERPNPVSGFRGDLRAPRISFGRCGITGQAAKCVEVDLGDTIVQIPGYTNATQEWIPPKDVTYRNALTLSQEGLQLLMTALETGANPIPSYVPNLKYQWEIMFQDGSAMRQFSFDEQGAEVESAFPLDRSTEITQVSLIDRTGLPNGLPTYTVNVEGGRFFRAGEELKTGYSGPLHPTRRPLCARKNNVLFGSQLDAQTMHRDIGIVNATVLYVLGWKDGGWGDQGASCNLIVVDERGAWRPYEQITPEEAAHYAAQQLRVAPV